MSLMLTMSSMPRIVLGKIGELINSPTCLLKSVLDAISFQLVSMRVITWTCGLELSCNSEVFPIFLLAIYGTFSACLYSL